jgi:hypothetical protein
VQPGYLLSPGGEEIWIPTVQQISLRGGARPTDPASAGGSDPWCTEVYVERPEGPVFLAVRYQQVEARPVPVQPGACGCDDLPCEASRYRDGFALGVLDECPDTGDPATTDAGNPSCATGPDDGWVVLAEITLDADGTITKIDNCACRRIVEPASWRRCTATDQDFPPREKAEEEDAPAEAAGAAGTTRRTSTGRARSRRRGDST